MQNETLKVLLTRRSVRKYRPEQIDRETLSAILEAGTYAPSGMGKQPGVIVAVQNPEDRRAVMELNKQARGGSGDPYYGAPTIVLVLADRGCISKWAGAVPLCGGRLLCAGQYDGGGPFTGGELLLDTRGAPDV